MDKEVKKYFANLPLDRTPCLKELHKLIVNLAPNVIVDMQYKMPTYHGGDGWVALANQKHYVSLYTCGAHHLEQFKRKHRNIKTGKGCINFKPTDPLPLPDICDVVRHAFNSPKTA